MKIHELTVRNFRAIVERTISFEDEDGEVRPLTLIVGPNRSGKTTMLDALRMVGGMGPPLAFDRRDPLLRPDPTKPIEVTVTFSLNEAEWDIFAAEYSQKEAYDRKRRTTVECVYKRKTDLFNRVMAPKEIAFRIRSFVEGAVTSRMMDEHILEEVGGLLYLNAYRTAILKGPNTRTGSPDELMAMAHAGDIVPWIEFQARLDVRWDPAKKGESQWNYLKRTYEQLAKPSTIDDVEPFSEGFDLRMKDTRTGRTYYSAGTSSGERVMLHLAANLVAWRAYNSVVLIDEVEQHLHPRWQRNLLHFCRRGGGANNQFIVTTHSQAILKYVDPDSVIELQPMEAG